MRGFEDERVLGRHRVGEVAGCGALDLIAAAFAVLAGSERAPVLPGVAESALLVQPLSLDQVRRELLDPVRRELLDPVVGCLVRERIWRELALQVRSGDPVWLVGALGVAEPRLRRIAAHLVDGIDAGGLRAQVEPAVVTGLVSGLRLTDLERRHLEARLLWSAHRAGASRLCSALGGEPGAAEVMVRVFRRLVPEETSVAPLLE
ncbi:hypothetical protein [Actinomadura rupiterrae]|uniref:hypothetical protein n=1 Tax=Actinomadura rupiterrae TaxID=559627 RepID=UPI0020A3C4DC|nr:hypothetical protein [Actinomadura rupiterrae]MCP2339244.1 putative kinase [Actinomadura rupiterrae]